MTRVSPEQPSSPRASRSLNVCLWVVQALLGVTFAGTGVWKLLTPIAQLGAKMPWMGQVAPGFLYMTAVVDFLGGAGLLLPALTRIKPWLVVWAALGCAALQGCAIVFHVSRGEGASTPFNALLVALSLFIAWGRQYKAPLLPRQSAG